MAIRTEHRGRVVEVVLDHPPHNILTIAVCRELTAKLSETGDARVVLLRAEGERFSVGADVEEHLPAQAAEMLTAMRELIERLIELPLPSVVAVHADAFGGGLELVTACDLAVVAETASLGQPEIRLGCFAPFAAALLPKAIGTKATMDLLLRGDPIDARTAVDIGLVSRVCPPDDVLARARRLAEQVATHSGPALAACRRAVHAGVGKSAVEALRAAQRIYLTDSVPTADYTEGLKAFLEKRDPEWKDG